MGLPIYMDYHATTPVDPGVLEAMLPFFKENFGNPASRNHPFGWHAEGAVEASREQVIGAAFRVSAQRGQVLELPPAAAVDVTPEPIVVATVHPSSVLRDRSDSHDEAYRLFVDDLRSARRAYAP